MEIKWRHSNDGESFDGSVISDDEKDAKEEENVLRVEKVKEEQQTGVSVHYVLEKVRHMFSTVSFGVFELIKWVVVATFTLVPIACVVVFVIFMVDTFRKVSLETPRQDLQNFVLSQKEKIGAGVSSLDLETDGFEAYSAAYCLEGTNLEIARDALSAGLVGVPQSVKDNIVTMALREGITAKNTWRNSNADLVNTNKAHSYMAYYSTTYERSGNLDIYQTCVTVTGISFSVAEIVVAYTETEEDYLMGTKLDCSAAFIFCDRVPVYGKRKVKIPQFKRSTLSLKQQEELHSWMIHQAIESAGYLVMPSKHAKERYLSSKDDFGWRWVPPEYAIDEPPEYTTEL